MSRCFISPQEQQIWPFVLKNLNDIFGYERFHWKMLVFFPEEFSVFRLKRNVKQLFFSERLVGLPGRWERIDPCQGQYLFKEQKKLGQTFVSWDRVSQNVQHSVWTYTISEGHIWPDILLFRSIRHFIERAHSCFIFTAEQERRVCLFAYMWYETQVLETFSYSQKK
jgi:hypothetical protein